MRLLRAWRTNVLPGATSKLLSDYPWQSHKMTWRILSVIISWHWVASNIAEIALFCVVTYNVQTSWLCVLGDYAVLGVPCETTRHGCSLWCLYPHYPFSIHIFYLVMNIEKTSLVKILGNFSFVSIYYHWNWFEDLHPVQGIEIKDDSEMLHSQYLRENNGTTCHHGHPADCQLALTNVVEVQTKVVTND